MKNLDRLFRERFLVTTSLECFLQGMASPFVPELTHKDVKTSKQMFQLCRSKNSTSAGKGARRRQTIPKSFIKNGGFLDRLFGGIS
ncbi:hypothetical protein OBV_38420 [Oscillibacter valericigenes Sjm18-20]|nr:hypothetical protein OBV_38420 [Oscillibacter valericigenes Sjm18-20]